MRNAPGHATSQLGERDREYVNGRSVEASDCRHVQANGIIQQPAASVKQEKGEGNCPPYWYRHQTAIRQNQKHSLWTQKVSLRCGSTARAFFPSIPCFQMMCL